MGTRYSEEVKEAVLKLGGKGWTYSQIQSKYPVPKSTLSVWFNSAGKGRDRTKQIEHLKNARLHAAEIKREQRLARLAVAEKSASKELENLDLADTSFVKALLAMLYWAEGGKSDRSGLIFVNTDPDLLSLYVNLLRKAFPVEETRLRAKLHLHDYHSPREALNFWSHLLNIPKSQFGKIYVKKRSTHRKFRENFKGICTVCYFGTAERRELMSLAKQLATKSNTLSSFNG